jgi:hypothetical protein
MSTPARRPRALRARDVADLTVTSGYPCISILAPTEPAPRMTAPDLAQLRKLVVEVEQELQQHGVPSGERLMRRLAGLVDRAAAQPTDRALAIYVNLAIDRTFRLPLPVTPRAVVERTFATRPLLTALHRMPPHVLLVLHPACAHLYQGVDGGLSSVGHRDLFRRRGGVRLPREGEAAADAVAEDLVDTFLREVDRYLGEYRTDHPSPLVLGGAPHLVDRFCSVSRHLDRLAGRVPPEAGGTALDLARASADVVERYLRSRRDEAVDQLREALVARPADVARGMAACWQTVHQRSPGMLLVEEDYVSPGRPDEEGPRPQVSNGSRAVHDLVDDLMEVVIMRGGQLALVANGDLAEHGRVALISRPR